MDRDLPAAIDDLETMYLTGALPEPGYYQCLLTIASEYLVRRHDPEQALIVINKIPADYYLQVLQSQLEDDQLFAAVTVELAARLVQLGLAGVDPETPNQPQGSA